MYNACLHFLPFGLLDFGPFFDTSGCTFGIWISDFRVLDFEEGGAAELGGGADERVLASCSAN